MHTPTWLLLRLNRARTPYLSNTLSGGDGPSPTPVPAGATRKGFPPAPYQESSPRGLAEAASRSWVRGIVDVINNMLTGKLNVVLSLTLSANSGATTLIDEKIGPFSALLFSPLTANAAAEIGSLYVSSQKNGSAVISHTNNTQIDRVFKVCVLG